VATVAPYRPSRFFSILLCFEVGEIPRTDDVNPLVLLKDQQVLIARDYAFSLPALAVPRI